MLWIKFADDSRKEVEDHAILDLLIERTWL